MMEIERLSGGYNGKNVVENISFSVEKGEMVGILGPNGSGKSTLMKLMSGILPITTGKVVVQGKGLEQYHPKELAKKVSVLPQMHTHTFRHTVLETVQLGRYPFQKGLFPPWTKEDEQAVKEAIKYMKLEKYENNSIELLSGGERQRVFVAQALAQTPEILLLDEPTNHLDIAHQKQLLDIVREHVKQHNMTVVSIFHDVNLASIYCDKLLLLSEGKLIKFGVPSEVIQADILRDVYNVNVITYMHPEIQKPQITLSIQ